MFGANRNVTAQAVDIYALGSNDDGSKVWKNGQTLYTLPAVCFKMEYSNGDLYCLSDHNIWKNGQILYEFDSNYEKSFYVSGSDVYYSIQSQGQMELGIAHYVSFGTIYKNGQELYTIPINRVSDWAISDNDLYLIGVSDSSFWDENYYSLLEETSLKIWKNGQVLDTLHSAGLGDITNQQYIRDSYLEISGNDIYVANINRIWKNGIDFSTQLGLYQNFPYPPGQIGQGSFEGFPRFCVENQDVYLVRVLGLSAPLGTHVVKNGALIYSIMDSPRSCKANAMSVFSGDVYLAGAITLPSESQNSLGIIWKNGIPVDTLGKSLSDIKVVEHMFSPTGIDGVQTEAVNIYLNAQNGNLNINRPWHTIDNLEIADMSGRIVFRTSGLTAQSVNISNLSKGVYILKLLKDGQPYVKKFIKN
jgi:hypothetical protein